MIMLVMMVVIGMILSEVKISKENLPLATRLHITLRQGRSKKSSILTKTSSSPPSKPSRCLTTSLASATTLTSRKIKEKKKKTLFFKNKYKMKRKIPHLHALTEVASKLFDTAADKPSLLFPLFYSLFSFFLLFLFLFIFLRLRSTNLLCSFHNAPSGKITPRGRPYL